MAKTKPTDLKAKRTTHSRAAGGVQRQRSEKAKSRAKRKESYAIYIYRVLKQVHPETGISSKAMSIMCDIMMDMFERLAKEAAQLMASNKKRTISSWNFQSAVRLVLPGQLSEYANNLGTLALNKYNNSD